MSFQSIKITALALSLLAPAISMAENENSTMKGATKDEAGHLQVPLQVKSKIKAVYQISDDKLSKNLSRALVYADKLLNVYNDHGVKDEQVQLHLVFHGHGTNALVNTATRTRLEAAGSAENPNKKLIASLIKRGVKIELCQSSMEQRDVTSKDLLDGVITVVGAYPRLIELQMLGYAYIKFE